MEDERFILPTLRTATARAPDVRLAAATLAFLAVVSVARAQPAASAAEPHERELRARVGEEATAATALYVVSAVASVVAWLTTPFAIIGTTSCSGGSGCDAYYARESALFIGGLSAVALSGASLFIAIGLDVDAHSRRSGLERRAGRARVAPGPGEIGLALAIAF